MKPTKYELILNGLREFYNVNEDLREDLEEYSMETTDRTLDENIEMFAKINAKTKYANQIIEDINDLNAEPHSISEMEIMYETIDEFTYMKA